MKTITRVYLKQLLICIALLFLGSYSYSQSCPISVTPVPGPGGYTYFYATPPGTNSAMYSWSFGNGTSTAAINLNTVATTFTANGVYTVVVTYTDQVNSCTSLAAAPFTITSACSLSVNTTQPSSQNLCNGSATVSNTGLCGTPSYTWFPGPLSGTVTNNLCLGTYTVSATASGNCCPVVSTTFAITQPPCNLSGSTSTVNNGGGNVTLSSTATGTVAATTYTWNFGDGSPPVYSQSASHTYSANGAYSATVNVRNNYLCTSTSVIPLTITNSTYCNTSASFTYGIGANANVSFLSTSTGTTNNSTYLWKFGDGATATGISTSHTYANNGVYSLTLTVYKNLAVNSCVDSVSAPISITNACVLAAGFSSMNLGAGTVSFASTSTGTIPASTYLWNFGDSSPTSTLANPAHTYTSNGTYSVVLTVGNSTNCISVYSTQVQVNSVSVPCQLNANYSHIVGNSGQVNFTSSSTGTTNNTTYFWDFGDGIYSLAANPSHTYVYNGAYAVKLKINDANCADSTITSINVTGLPCLANAIFALSPGPQPQYWNATPVYPWNITSATWDWGDGSSTPGLYTSHIYSVAGTYSICLTVTTSCGATDSYCNPYAVYKTSEPQSVIYVNVTNPALVNSLASVTMSEIECRLFPNPGSGEFNLSLSGLNSASILISIYDLTGKLIYQEKQQATEQDYNTHISLDAGEGIYQLVILQDNKQVTKKIVITRN